MKRKLLEILACPIDKFHPLELFENKSDDEKITEGALYCQQCSRFFPILVSGGMYTSPSMSVLSPIFTL